MTTKSQLILISYRGQGPSAGEPLNVTPCRTDGGQPGGLELLLEGWSVLLAEVPVVVDGVA